MSRPGCAPVRCPTPPPSPIWCSTGTDAQSALARADRVWTMTSGLGFEALLRGIPVTTLGAPFYAGWGLTEDLGPIPPRRAQVLPRPDLDHLTHAALIGYPRYLDPVTRSPCPPELAVERLASGRTGPRRPACRTAGQTPGDPGRLRPSVALTPGFHLA